METGQSAADMNTLFRAPAAAQAVKVLDRSLFSQTLRSSAACPRENKLLARYMKDLAKTKELFRQERFPAVVSHPDLELAKKGQKCLILSPDVKTSSPESLSSVMKEALDSGDLSLIPYDINIDYTHWSYVDILRSILPSDLQNEIPSGFNSAGHVAHLNLREQYLPYKKIIAEVILDKNPHIHTVINKIDDVGTQNEFRTFSYEVLAGPDDLNVELREAGCIFQFDYGKVYWNSKLGTEHERIAGLFKKGEVVADVMAGIGPFAIPAGKDGVFVWANDKNPESYKYLEQGIQKNKVSEFVRPFNEDAHDFIRKAADLVLEASNRGDHALIRPAKVSRTSKAPKPEPKAVPIPPTISHYVMNLPASAIEFLHNFKGLYEGQEKLFAPHTETQLPIIHVHCFAPKPNNDAAVQGVLDRIEKEIGIRLVPGEGNVEGQAYFHEVRDVAPNKLMFCVDFRLPGSVAFASRS